MKIKSLLKIYLFYFFLLPPIYASIQDQTNINNPIENKNKIEQRIKMDQKPPKINL